MKARSHGNHFLALVGENLSGREIAETYRTRSTRVHLRPVPSALPGPSHSQSNNPEVDGNTNPQTPPHPEETNARIDEGHNDDPEEPPSVPPSAPADIISIDGDENPVAPETEMPEEDNLQTSEGACIYF